MAKKKKENLAEKLQENKETENLKTEEEETVIAIAKIISEGKEEIEQVTTEEEITSSGKSEEK